MRYDICAAHRVRCQAVGDAMVRAISVCRCVGAVWLGSVYGEGGVGAGREAGRLADRRHNISSASSNNNSNSNESNNKNSSNTSVQGCQTYKMPEALNSA